MIRCRFLQPTDDYRPLSWPLKHPYWVSGETEDAHVLVAYADDEAEILANWPEAQDLDSKTCEAYAFTDRFPRPVWFKAPE